MTTFAQGPTFSTTAALVGTINVVPYERMAAFADLSATTETINFTASLNGKNYSASKLRPIDAATGAVTASSDLKDGLYFFDLRGIHSIVIQKSSTSETLTLRTAFDL